MTKNQTSAVIGAVISFVIAILTIFGYNVLVVQPALEATPMAPSGAVVGSRGVTNFDDLDIDTLNVTGPTAIATATPVVIFDNLGAGNVIVSVRDAATPVWEVRNGGAVNASGNAVITGPTAAATATPALYVNNLGAANDTLVLADASTPVAIVGNAGAVTLSGALAADGGMSVSGGYNCIYNMGGGDLTIDPFDGVDKVLVLTDAAGDRLTNTTAGDFICLTGADTTYWVALARFGTWTDGN